MKTRKSSRIEASQAESRDDPDDLIPLETEVKKVNPTRTKNNTAGVELCSSLLFSSSLKDSGGSREGSSRTTKHLDSISSSMRMAIRKNTP